MPVHLRAASPPRQYQRPYSGPAGYSVGVPYATSSPAYRFPQRMAPIAPVLMAYPFMPMQNDQLRQAAMLTAMDFDPMLQGYILESEELLAGDAALSTVPDPEVCTALPEVTRLTDDLTAACSAGKIRIEQAAKLALATAEVLEAGANTGPALKNLRAELRSLRYDCSLSRDEFRKLSDEIDALIKPAVVKEGKDK